MKKSDAKKMHERRSDERGVRLRNDVKQRERQRMMHVGTKWNWIHNNSNVSIRDLLLIFLTGLHREAVIAFQTDTMSQMLHMLINNHINTIEKRKDKDKKKQKLTFQINLISLAGASIPFPETDDSISIIPQVTGSEAGEHTESPSHGKPLNDSTLNL